MNWGGVYDEFVDNAKHYFQNLITQAPDTEQGI